MPVSRDTAKTIFADMEKKIREHAWTDSDMFALVANFCGVNIRIAQGIANEIATILSESVGEAEYTDAVVQAYFNVLFDPEIAAKYGTAWLSETEHGMRMFVEQFSLEDPASLPQPSKIILPNSRH